jgi:uridine phosphorylase
MCDPATAITVVKGVTAVASAAASMEKTKNKNQQYANNVAASKDAYFLKSKQANLRVIQQQTQASQKLQDADLKAMQSQGTAIAAAGGAGVQGVNVDQLINDFERSEGVLADRTMQKLEDIQAQNEMTKLGYQSEAINRINSIQPVGFAEAMAGVIEPLASFGIDTYGRGEARAEAQGVTP